MLIGVFSAAGGEPTQTQSSRLVHCYLHSSPPLITSPAALTPPSRNFTLFNNILVNHIRLCRSWACTAVRPEADWAGCKPSPATPRMFRRSAGARTIVVAGRLLTATCLSGRQANRGRFFVFSHWMNGVCLYRLVMVIAAAVGVNDNQYDGKS